MNRNQKMICVLIQARMTSTRLPGKVLCPINGRPMLLYMLERVNAAKHVNQVTVVTSIDPSDDPIADICKENRIICFRGSLDDVLDRYYQAALYFKADIIVRLTGDCPLIDPRMIDAVIDVYIKGEYDYIANTVPPKWTVPEGMDVEVFSFHKLKQVWLQAKKPSEREHVTFYFWQNPALFSIFKYNIEEDLSQYRLTVDYPEDMEVIKAIISALYPQDHLFTMEDIVIFLKKRPEIHRLNMNIKANQGWASVCKKDRKAGLTQ